MKNSEYIVTKDTKLILKDEKVFHLDKKGDTLVSFNFNDVEEITYIKHLTFRMKDGTEHVFKAGVTTAQFIFVIVLSLLTIAGVILAVSYDRQIDKILFNYHMYFAEKLKSYKENEEKISIPNEILKYKKLLDENIITSEEFEKKKKELLELNQ